MRLFFLWDSPLPGEGCVTAGETCAGLDPCLTKFPVPHAAILLGPGKDTSFFAKRPSCRQSGCSLRYVTRFPPIL